ncbi:MAG: uroporphyrinogen-III C-methyltransferase [Opitutaceae bacterium]
MFFTCPSSQLSGPFESGACPPSFPLGPSQFGRVFLVGAGPGAADLLTLRALRLIREADVLVHDHLVSPEILDLAPASARRVYVGKQGGGFCSPQRDIESLLIAEARTGRDVVRLKGGDPFIFGRGGEEAEALAAAGIEFEVVPGVTAGLAAAAATVTPLTHRGVASAVVFLTGHEDPAKPEGAIRWEDYGRLGATLCVYMGMKNLETIMRRLQAGGLSADTPAAVIQNATTPRQTQFVSTAGNLALESERAGFGAPAIVIIGEAVRTPSRLRSLAAQAVERDVAALT